MPFIVTLHTDPLVAHLGDLRSRQLPFATALALNRTAEEGQAAVRARIFQRGFIVRSAQSARFLARSVKFGRGDRATKDRLSATVRIEPPGRGGGRSGLLGFLEEGGVRFSQFAIGSGQTFGPSSVAIPARGGKSPLKGPMDSHPRNLYPSMTGLQERRSISGKFTKGALRGKRGTFAVRTGPQEGLVLRRTGPGKKDVQTLFVIKPRARVEGRRFFGSTMERIAMERLALNLQEFLAFAERTAR